MTGADVTSGRVTGVCPDGDTTVSLRERAGVVSGEILDRLADPAATIAATRIPAEAADDGRAEPVWAELTLGSGSPGLALAFAGAARDAARQVPRAHAYLTAGTRAVSGGSVAASGIFKGPGALAFAVLVAHRTTGGYVSALERFDAYQRDLVRTVLPPVEDRPLPTIGQYEVVRGLTGVGRYLLARAETCEEPLRAVLGHLVRLSLGAVEHQGARVPRWWALDAPRIGSEAAFPGGHLNLGLSHGVAGPLALMALAWEQGVRVAGQREAMEATADLLETWAVADRHGPFWPGYLSFAEWQRGPAAYDGAAKWPGWCYGAPGVSRALQLAGGALGRTDLSDLARASVERLLVLPRSDWGVNDHALCHGWSGALHQLGRLNEEWQDPRLTALRDDIAAGLVSAFDPALPFGLRFTMTKVPFGSDVSGYLDGAAGVALALDSYAVDGTPADWDMPLLVA
ncbi:lanthionine synthetase C family protein [Streptomyces sp. Vc74B-19]|uniref:lanthionine synthetase C family protein n=1 Tax=Streptomyces sp. Vc74B-19 TaxID=2741324 RepID=UPI001BFCD12F|nr:lanthionine synthetase C family protein [Streptomyces sp. Vc74B-19]MBT3164744.1 lanthionine synthetase C family protein [Streptomyces sp. Vc74B-19]